MLVEYFLEPDIPHNIIHPVPYYIPPFPFEVFLFHLLDAHMLHLTCCYRFALRSILLQINSYIEIIYEIVYAFQAKQQFRRHVNPNVYALGY